MTGDDISKVLAALANLPPVQAAAAAIGGVAAYLVWRERDRAPRVDPLTGISKQIENLDRKLEEKTGNLHKEVNGVREDVAFLRGKLAAHQEPRN